MAKPKKINACVEIHDLYQLLIAECRYGYTRNNHLMPDGAYQHVKEYLPIMFKKDPEVALNTACQLCEECISNQLSMNFFDGLDDEHGSRQEAIKFVDYLLDWIHSNGEAIIGTNYGDYFPYNYDMYKDNLEKEKGLKYRVYERDAFEIDSKKIRELTTEPVDATTANKILFTDELHSNQCVINHLDIKTDEYPIRVIGDLIRIIEPEDHAGKIYSIELIK